MEAVMEVVTEVVTEVAEVGWVLEVDLQWEEEGHRVSIIMYVSKAREESSEDCGQSWVSWRLSARTIPSESLLPLSLILRLIIQCQWDIWWPSFLTAYGA